MPAKSTMAFDMCGLIVMNRTVCPEHNANFSPRFNPMTHESTFEVVMELYVISLLCAMGLFGNIVSIVVLRRDKERRNALFLLQALAIADSIYVITAIFRYPMKYMIPNKEIYVSMQPYVFPLLKTAQTITIWMMVLVTVDRYVYVCKPLHAQFLFSQSKRRLASVGVFVLGALYNVPRFMDSCVMSFHDTCTNHTISRMVYTPLFKNTLYFDIYQYAMYMAFLYVLPLATLAVLNHRLVVAIHHSRRRQQQRLREQRQTHILAARQASGGTQYSENNATLVLVIIVLVFIVCETPELILKIVTVVERHVSTARLFSAGLVHFGTVNEVLMVINSSINFVIYAAFGKRFRHIMKETFKYLSFANQSTMTHETVPLAANQYLKIARK